jgi:hypothetical protein
MKQYFNQNSLLKNTFHTASCLFLLVLASCTKNFGDDSDSSGPSTGPKKNVIQGMIYDAHGKPFNIPGARAEANIYANGAIGQDDPSYIAKADAKGHYAVKVANNVYGVNATAYIPLNGQTVAIDLMPTDGKDGTIQFPSAPGVVRDFKLQLTGPIPGGDPSTIQGYYGAKIWFGDGYYNFNSYGDGYWHNLSTKYPNAKVQFLLMPISPLIDGSKGENIAEEATVDDIKTGKWFVNVPLAAYRVYGRLITANGETINLTLSNVPNISSSSEYVDLSFAPENTFGAPRKEQVAVWE